LVAFEKDYVAKNTMRKYSKEVSDLVKKFKQAGGAIENMIAYAEQVAIGKKPRIAKYVRKPTNGDLP
jgi:hypothetical protein